MAEKARQIGAFGLINQHLCNHFSPPQARIAPLYMLDDILQAK
jgi:hypothetical protein